MTDAFFCEAIGELQDVSERPRERLRHAGVRGRGLNRVPGVVLRRRGALVLPPSGVKSRRSPEYVAHLRAAMAELEGGLRMVEAVEEGR